MSGDVRKGVNAANDTVLNALALDFSSRCDSNFHTVGAFGPLLPMHNWSGPINVSGQTVRLDPSTCNS